MLVLCAYFKRGNRTTVYMYSIKELERLSGIKAPTLRIWEKRYNLLEPERTETNIRIYNDDNLIKLLNVATLLDHDWKISKVSKLTPVELRSTVKKIMQNNRFSESDMVNALFLAALSFDEGEVERLLAHNFLHRGVKKTVLTIIYPLMVKIGIAWRVKEVVPAQEHFVSNIIRRKLLTAIDGLPQNEDHNETFILFLPENEWHEIGLLLAHYVLRYYGYRTLYLGSSVPYENVKLVAQRQKADYLLLMFTRPTPDQEVVDYLKQLSEDFPKKQIFVSGAQAIQIETKRLPYNVSVLDNPNMLMQLFGKSSTEKNENGVMN